MRTEPESTDQPDRHCPQCGRLIPRQKKGRRRKYCSRTCRQHAYEKRNGLPNWNDQRLAREAQSKLKRTIRRTEHEKRRRLEYLIMSEAHGSHERVESCIEEVRASELATAEVIEWASFLVLDERITKTAMGEYLGRMIEQLVSDVRLVGFRAVPIEDYRRIRFSTTEPKGNDSSAIFHEESEGGVS